MPTTRKTKSEISLTYQGGAAYSLFASDFSIAKTPPLAIELDLTCNLRVRDKSSNTFADARDFAKGRHAELAAIRIHDAQLCKALRKAHERHPGAGWRLVVHVQDQAHAYAVNVIDEPYSVALRVALSVVPT